MNSTNYKMYRCNFSILAGAGVNTGNLYGIYNESSGIVGDGGYFDQWNNQIFAPKTNLGFTYFLDRRTLKITSNTNNCNETYIIDLTEKDNSFYSLENCNNLHNALTSNEDLLYRDIDPEDLTFIEARIDDLLNIEIEKCRLVRRKIACLC